MNYCTGCGHKIDSAAKFCTGCGKQLVVIKQRKRTNPFSALFAIGFMVLLANVVPAVMASQDSNTPITPVQVDAMTNAVIFTGIPITIVIWLLWCVGYYVWRRTAA